MHDIIQRFVDATNAFDVKAALSLFAADAVIRDVSVGDDFAGHAGIRRYMEQFFVGYRTRSKILSFTIADNGHASIRLDFTGDFGHEIGTIDMMVGSDGLIASMDADLE